ncbi:MAG: hypothetical protein NUV57_04280 [archaeon]|nr:hypothetical protein [archaeon]
MEFNTNVKGQASIEFLFVMLIAIVFIVAIVQPSADLASNSTKDVANLTQLKISAEKLASTIEFVSLSGTGTRQTITITVPKESTLKCDPASNSTKIITEYTALSHAQQPIIGVNGCDKDTGICTNTIILQSQIMCEGNKPEVAIPEGQTLNVKVENNGTPSIQVTFI